MARPRIYVNFAANDPHASRARALLRRHLLPRRLAPGAYAARAL